MPDYWVCAAIGFLIGCISCTVYHRCFAPAPPPVGPSSVAGFLVERLIVPAVIVPAVQHLIREFVANLPPPEPERPVTTGELREQLGGQAPPARFNAEGGWRPSEN